MAADAITSYYTINDGGSNYYVNQRGETWRRGKNEFDSDSLVMEGYATIREELIDLHGNVSYLITGYDAIRREGFSFTIPVGDFLESKKLKGALASKFGPRAMFYLKGRSGERPAENLENIIRQVTRPDSYRRITSVDRVMWHGNRLIVPTMVPEGYRIEIDPERLPYNMPADLDIDTGMEALVSRQLSRVG